jgi:phage gpG-like protein
MEYKEAILKLLSNIPVIEKEFEKDIFPTLQQYIANEMSEKEVSASWRAGKSNEAFPLSGDSKSLSSKLNVKSGKLLASFMPNNPDTLSSFNNSNNNINVFFGSKTKYAAIHEDGGFIRSKGKMDKYFWAVYFQTGNSYYKNLALGVMKRGGVNIPKRPYFKPGLQNFQDKGITIMITDIANKILDYYAKL